MSKMAAFSLMHYIGNRGPFGMHTWLAELLVEGTGHALEKDSVDLTQQRTRPHFKMIYCNVTVYHE
jgi:hypothetical protein